MLAPRIPATTRYNGEQLALFGLQFGPDSMVTLKMLAERILHDIEEGSLDGTVFPWAVVPVMYSDERCEFHVIGTEA